MTQPLITPPLTWLRAFELLRGSVLESAERPRRLRIGCFPFLADEVIVPRLDEIKRALPGTAITLRNETHLDALLDAQRDRGAGICLGILPFMRPWLAACRVQMIGSLTTRIDERAYLVYGLHNEHNRDIPRLHEWLKAALT